MNSSVNLSIEAESDEFLDIGDVFLHKKKFQAARDIFQAARPRSSAGVSKVRSRLALLEKWESKDQGILSFMVDCLLTIENFQNDRNLGQVYVGYGLISFQKNQGFLRDNHFMQICDKYSHLLPIPGWHWNLSTIAWAVASALKLPGDFVELGVFKGHTTKVMADYFSFSATTKTWYLYDTFDGIPDDQIDSDRWRTLNQQTYKNTYDYESVKEEFSGYPNIRVIKGKVPDILGEVCPKEIAFLHIDLNNTKAEIAALDYLFDKHIVPGGIIVFDDFGWLSAHMQFAAENEWAAKRGLRILELPTGQGLLIKPL